VKVIVIRFDFVFQSVLQLCDLNTGALIKNLPLDVGSVVGFTGRKDQNEIFYLFNSFLTPGIIYHCDLSKPDPEPTVSSDHNVISLIGTFHFKAFSSA